MPVRASSTAVALAAAAVALLGSAASACEPCAETLDLDATAAEADLIFVAEAPGRTPFSLPENASRVEVKPLRVLKGMYDEKTIVLTGWQGMCSYGFVRWSAKRELVFAMQPSQKGEHWRAVRWGCAVKSLPVAGGKVVADGKPVALAKRFAAKRAR